MRKIRKIKHGRTTASNPRHNDVYVVAYPKSGITWLATMLANMALCASGRREIATFVSASIYVPDIHVTRELGSVAYTIPPVRFIKSHSEFNSNYNFVIYLVRDPLAVMKSYYRYCHELGNISSMSFETFCRHGRYGIPAWKRHINSWVVGGVLAQRVHLLDYNRLVASAANELRGLCDSFGWAISDEVIESAVANSSVHVMRESESLARKYNPRYTMKFVRGGGKEEVDGSVIEYIRNETLVEVERVGISV